MTSSLQPLRCLDFFVGGWLGVAFFSVHGLGGLMVSVLGLEPSRIMLTMGYRDHQDQPASLSFEPYSEVGFRV